MSCFFLPNSCKYKFKKKITVVWLVMGMQYILVYCHKEFISVMHIMN